MGGGGGGRSEERSLGQKRKYNVACILGSILGEADKAYQELFSVPKQAVKERAASSGGSIPVESGRHILLMGVDRRRDVTIFHQPRMRYRSSQRGSATIFHGDSCTQ